MYHEKLYIVRFFEEIGKPWSNASKMMMKGLNWETWTKEYWNGIYCDLINTGKTSQDSKYFKYALIIQLLYTFSDAVLGSIDRVTWSDLILIDDRDDLKDEKIPMDIDSFWILKLYNNISKQYEAHYVDDEFKSEWDKIFSYIRFVERLPRWEYECIKIADFETSVGIYKFLESGFDGVWEKIDVRCF
jgi:hypothetical protein